MMPPESPEITALLKAWGSGDASALSPQSVMRDRKLAKAWLTRELTSHSADGWPALWLADRCWLNRARTRLGGSYGIPPYI